MKKQKWQKTKFDKFEACLYNVDCANVPCVRKPSGYSGPPCINTSTPLNTRMIFTLQSWKSCFFFCYSRSIIFSIVAIQTRSLRDQSSSHYDLKTKVQGLKIAKCKCTIKNVKFNEGNSECENWKLFRATLTDKQWKLGELEIFNFFQSSVYFLA